MNETSGLLAKYVQQFMSKDPLTEDALKGLKIYFGYWADYPYPVFNDRQAQQLSDLRKSIGEAKTKEDLHRWLDEALKLGIDPL